MLSVALVDDHLLFREGLRAMLASAPDLRIVAEASNAQEAISAVRASQPEVVVLDVMLPGVSGIGVARELLREDPHRRVLALSMVADEGAGIPAFVEGRLFEPFFTTKGTKGTGLGLWLAAGTMERLGGTIRAVNRPRSGALFVLTFPLADINRPVHPAASESSPATARRERSAPAARRPPRRRRNR